MDRKEKQVPAYTKPEVADYGDLQQLTSTITSKGLTDVPLGSPGPTNAFSHP